VPERYALMTGVGKVERDVLWRTARIRVLPYDEGKHEQVLEFLRTLFDEVNGDSAAAISPVASVAIPAPAHAVGAASASLIPSTILSTPLSIRLGGQLLEAGISRGANAVQGLGAPPDWSHLPKLIEGALGNQANSRLLGQELGKLLPEVVLNALK